VNPERVTANLRDGVLEVTLQKTTGAKANKVEVKAA
jgi:HSP20 family molecular chaperone IbpA